MENFSGIIICITNHLEYMDTAVMRRFSWKVEFKPLRAADENHLFGQVGFNYFL